MNELINGKIPESIKNTQDVCILSHDCNGEECPYYHQFGCLDACVKDVLDLIAKLEAERDAALDKQSNMKHMQTGEVVELFDYDSVAHARWIKTWDMFDGHDGYKCSACGHVKYFDHYNECIKIRTAYCENCGAKMDIGEREP